jgi:hypothetical protein
MVFNHFAHDGKPNAGAAVFRIAMQPGKYIKNAFGIFLFKTNPIVPDSDLMIVFSSSARRCGRASFLL